MVGSLILFLGRQLFKVQLTFRNNGDLSAIERTECTPYLNPQQGRGKFSLPQFDLSFFGV